MPKSQLELLVLYQDVKTMLKEAEEEETSMGFSFEGKAKLEEAKEELGSKIKPQYLRSFDRLHTRYRHPISPVQNETCLGCFAKLPTSYSSRGRDDQTIFTCEQCGRMLYWID